MAYLLKRLFGRWQAEEKKPLNVYVMFISDESAGQEEVISQIQRKVIPTTPVSGGDDESIKKAIEAFFVGQFHVRRYPHAQAHKLIFVAKDGNARSYAEAQSSLIVAVKDFREALEKIEELEQL